MQKRQVIVCIVAFFIAAIYVLDYAFPLKVPDPKDSFSQVVIAKEGQTLRAFADANGIWRQPANIDSVSEYYLEALIVYEDRWFWYHPGVNPLALARAFWLNWQCDCVVSGGSTLTMQVARILHPHAKTIAGKLYQMLRALQLEAHFSKAEILTLYLNYAPFGGTVEGIEAASAAYLNKPSATMTHAEAALMAVLPQSPSRIRPDRHADKAQLARNKVLQRMFDLGYWSETTVVQAELEQVIADQPMRPSYAPLLSRELSKKFNDQQVIRTTIDFDMQQGIEDQLKNWIQGQPMHSSAAILVVDNRSMEVRAYLGSADFADKSRFGHVDMVRAVRSPGSTLKPFIYGIAMDKGLIHSQSLLSDAPRYYSEYKPENFSQNFSGPVSVTDALQRSLNVPAVQVLNHLGPAYFHSKLKAAGIPLILPENSKPSLAIALGGAGIDLWHLVSAYAALVNHGAVRQVRTTVDEAVDVDRYLLSEESAWVIYKILASHLRPGQLHNENLVSANKEVAWKTGTSYGYRDAWAIGTNKNYTIGVWLGRPDGTPQPGHFGSLNAAPLMLRLSDSLHSQQKTSIVKPDKVTKENICWPLGKEKGETRDELCHQTLGAWIIDQNFPPTVNENKESQWMQNPLSFWINPNTGLLIDINCESSGRKKKQVALWPKVLEPWLTKKYTRAWQIPKPDPACNDAPQLDVGEIKIIGIEDGNIFKSARQAEGHPYISLQAIGGLGLRDWFVNGKYIYSAEEKQAIKYQFKQLGLHQIVVVDQQGDSDKIDVHVEAGI